MSGSLELPQMLPVLHLDRDCKIQLAEGCLVIDWKYLSLVEFPTET